MSPIASGVARTQSLARVMRTVGRRGQQVFDRLAMQVCARGLRMLDETDRVGIELLPGKPL